MEVTIEVKVNTSPAFREEVTTSWWTGRITKVREIPIPSTTTYDVHLTLIPSEAERATIFKYKLAELIVEQEPVYSKEYIDECYERYKNTGDELLRNVNKRNWEEVRDKKTVYRIQDYFNNPFIRQFSHPQEAHAYVDKLKNDVLPTIKGNIDDFAVRSDKEWFSL